MKKSKLSITLVTSFIAAMALTACNEVTASKEAIVSFRPYSGSKESISLITDDVYNAYRGTTNGVSKFYDKILEVLIRYEFKDAKFNDGEMNYDDIDAWADNQVKEQKKNAENNAKSNGTNYDDEWDAILESNNVENAKELKEKFIYQKEKEVITNWYADNTDNAEALKNEFLGIDKDNKPVDQSTVEVKAAMPYHVRHILVSVDEASNTNEKFYKGTITEEKAKKLSDIVTDLATSKKTFAEIAADSDSDDGSKTKGGDVGIMTNDATSGSLGMVNEFQLGIYAYDNLYTANKDDAYAPIIQNGLGINDDVKNALAGGLVEVPYEAFVKIGKYAAATADKEGNKIANGSEALYPRNILWNKYFNLHNVFVIKNAKDGAGLFGTDHAKDEFAYNNLCKPGEKYEADDAKVPGFNATTGYLEDERGNVIIGVRSQYGIHLMIIEESMYDYANLATYYSTKISSDEGYSPDSYVGFVEGSGEKEKERADEVKSKITSFDATYDYRLYTYLTGKVDMKFADAASDLEDKIERYIDSNKINNAYKQEDGLSKVWRTYTELLEVQETNRAYQFNTINAKGKAQNNLTRLVSEKAADDFIKLYEGGAGITEADYAPFLEETEGGYYYYA